MSNTSRMMQAAAAGVPGDEWTLNNVRTPFRPLGWHESAGAGQTTWHPDGTYFVEVDTTGLVRQWECTDPWEPQTASIIKTYSVTAQDTNPYGVFVRNDGRRMFVTGADNCAIYEYALGYSWDISSAAYVRQYSFGWGTDIPVNITFESGGARMVVSRNGATDGIYVYRMTTAWNIGTLSLVNSNTVDFANVWGFAIGGAGLTRLFVGNKLTRQYNYYNLTGGAWNVSPGNVSFNSFFDDGVWYANGTSASPSLSRYADYISFKSDGTKMFIKSGRGTYNYNLPSAFSFVGAERQIGAGNLYKWPGTQTIASEGKNGIVFNRKGTAMYVADSYNDTVQQFSLSVPYDISTASYVTQINSLLPQPTDLCFSRDGTILFVKALEQYEKYTLGTAFDISTASLSSTTSLPDAEGETMFFREDGLKLYVGWGRTIYQWTLGTAYDLATASFDTAVSVILSGGSLFSSRNLYGLRFDNSGTRFIGAYRVRSGFPSSLSYLATVTGRLSTPWDITSFDTLSRKTSFIPESDRGYISDAGGIGVSPDGSYMYTPIRGPDTVLQYFLK